MKKIDFAKIGFEEQTYGAMYGIWSGYEGYANGHCYIVREVRNGYVLSKEDYEDMWIVRNAKDIKECIMEDVFEDLKDDYEGDVVEPYGLRDGNGNTINVVWQKDGLKIIFKNEGGPTIICETIEELDEMLYAG